MNLRYETAEFPDCVCLWKALRFPPHHRLQMTQPYHLLQEHFPLYTNSTRQGGLAGILNQIVPVVSRHNYLFGFPPSEPMDGRSDTGIGF